MGIDFTFSNLSGHQYCFNIRTGEPHNKKCYCKLSSENNPCLMGVDFTFFESLKSVLF